jgi:hypothetical protein
MKSLELYLSPVELLGMADELSLLDWKTAPPTNEGDLFLPPWLPTAFEQ